MKKRSLFAAVAMLIVSAVVLSSATYAWFASSASITSTTIQSTVTNSQGGILISEVNTGNWRTNITKGEYNDIASNYFPAALDPVSGTVGTNAVTFKDCSLQGTTFTASAASNSKDNEKVAAPGWVTYTTYAKAQANGTLTLTPSFSTDSPFVYYAIFVKDSTGAMKTTTSNADAKLFLDKTGDSYKPTTSTSGTATDTVADNIISQTESDAGSISLGTQQSATATSSQTLVLTMTADEIITIDIYMWAEGQDSDCKGTVPTQTSTSALAFSYAYADANANNGGN